MLNFSPLASVSLSSIEDSGSIISNSGLLEVQSSITVSIITRQGILTVVANFYQEKYYSPYKSLISYPSLYPISSGLKIIYDYTSQDSLLDNTLDILGSYSISVKTENNVLDTQIQIDGTTVVISTVTSNGLFESVNELTNSKERVDINITDSVLQVNSNIIGVLVKSVIVYDNIVESNLKLEGILAVSRYTNPGILSTVSNIVGRDSISVLIGSGLLQCLSKIDLSKLIHSIPSIYPVSSLYRPINNIPITVRVSNTTLSISSGIDISDPTVDSVTTPGLFEFNHEFINNNPYINISTNTGLLFSTSNSLGFYTVNVTILDSLLYAESNLDSNNYSSVVTSVGLLNTDTSFKYDIKNISVLHPTSIYPVSSIFNKKYSITNLGYAHNESKLELSAELIGSYTVSISTNTGLLILVSATIGTGTGREKDWIIIDPPTTISLTPHNNISKLTSDNSIFSINKYGSIHKTAEDYSVKSFTDQERN